jgi:Domain of unknown function DUF1828
VTLLDLAETFSQAVGAEVRVEPLGAREARVFVPFEFPDGDRLVVRLRRQSDTDYEWTDTGHTFMHLSYDLDVDALEGGNRKTLLESIEQRAGVKERSGELVLPTHPDVVAGDLFQFVQALLQISDLRFLSRERVRSTFVDDLRTLLSERFGDHAHFDYYDHAHDPEGRYPVDCLLNGLPRPIAIFGVGSDSQARDATITLLQFRTWKKDLFAAGVHEEMEGLSGKVLARLSDVVDKQFSSLTGNEQAIVDYLQREIDRQRS